MNLLISVGFFYPSQIGGPGNTLYWIGKHLVENDIKVTVLVSDIGVPKSFAPRDKWTVLDGIRIKYCNVTNPYGLIKLTWNTIKELTHNDVVMLSSLLYKPNFFVGIVALIYKKNNLVTTWGVTYTKRFC